MERTLVLPKAEALPLLSTINKGATMSCGCSGTIENDFLAQEIQDKINNHPCYSEGAHHHYARIHLAVAPACNIQCNYCNRKYDCSNESRPGVTSAKLKPIEAVKKVLMVGAEIKQLSVVGIAGPGDALANPKQTFETFELLKEHAPDLKLCISTNGLQLQQYAQKLAHYGVDHITVTINTIDPKVGAQIYPWVYDTITKRRYKGEEGAALLLERQLEGIQKCISLGILIKANSVLIPGINEDDLINVSKKLKSMGVFLHNIMPLLSEPEFGTYFGLNGVRSATDSEVMKAQEDCGMDMRLMTHCRQCRADAVGLIGEDRGDEFTKERVESYTFEELTKMYNIEARQKTHENIELFRGALEEANKRVKMEKDEISSNGETILVAVTSQGEGLVNQHFGSAKEFLIYEAGDKGVKFRMHRKIANPYCSGPENCNGSNPIDEIKERLQDCKILITEKIGDCPQSELQSIGLVSDMSYPFIPIEVAVLRATRKYFGASEDAGEVEVN